jgi:hypothetical protein
MSAVVRAGKITLPNMVSRCGDINVAKTIFVDWT